MWLHFGHSLVGLLFHVFEIWCVGTEAFLIFEAILLQSISHEDLQQTYLLK
jgi:hypothetical protein